MDNEPKPVVTGYPAAAQPPHAAAAHGVPAHGTAYPYPYPAHAYYAAQPPPPPGPYYEPPAAYGGGGSGSTTFLRRLIIITIAVFLLVGFATFVVWLVLRPRVPEFAVSSASVSSFNVSGAALSAVFNLSLSVRNPSNRVGISYDEMEAAVLYGSDLLAETSLPPFYQGKGSSMTVPARLAAVSTYVSSGVADGIARERSSSGGALVFHVRVGAWVRFRSGAWRTRRHLMRVLCDNVKIGFGNATSTVGALAGAVQSCEVHI